MPSNPPALPRPAVLAPIVAISAWMTYRAVGLPFLPQTELFGGDAMAAAWAVPLGQDALIGLTAPFVTYLLATRPRVSTYAIGAAWLWWGIVDLVVGVVTELSYPPAQSPFGPHTPAAMTLVWLVANLTAEVVALGLFALPSVRDWFADPEHQGQTVTLRQSPMRGGWLLLVAAGTLMTVFFGQVAAAFDLVFAALGFPAA